MILSSFGCKVSWALRGGMRHLRMPLLFFRLAGVATIRKSSVDSRLFANRICSQSSAHIHLKICSFFDEDGSCVGSADNPFRLVCQPQERGTLLSSLPGRGSPAVAFGYAPAVKIRLPRLFPLFLGGCPLQNLPHRSGGTTPNPRTGHRGFAHFFIGFIPFRDGRDDGVGV